MRSCPDPCPANPHHPQPFIEQQRQQERERVLREQNERQIDQRLPAPEARPVSRIPDAENPCFRIGRVLLVGDASDSFQWAVSPSVLSGTSGDDSPLGRCLGTSGVNVVLARAQAEVIARGWTTTRVLAAPQDLTTGTLTLTLVPGRIAAIRLSADSTVPLLGQGALLATAIPASPGDLLNLRAIEQGLENLKRSPTAEADIQIEPSSAPNAAPGESDLVVKYVQSKKWRLSFSLDDSGTETTGRYQGGITASLDNPLGLNDLFYVNANHNIGRRFLRDADRGTEGQTLHYSVPYGWWLLGFTASNSQYFQTVAGLYEGYVYAGKTNNAELKLTRMLWRDQHRKTSASLKVWRREARNFVDDAEVPNQRRVTGGWELAVNHKEFIETRAGTATLEGTLAYKRGTGGLGSRAAPEEIAYRNDPKEPLEGTSRMRLYTAELSANVPFKLGEQTFRNSGLIRAQWNRTPLTPQDRFAIGGRYTVRGFDGETSLMAERGWLIRNDIGWGIGQSGAELYTGLDYGHVGGPSTKYLLGNHLAGAVVGVRGDWKNLNYDVFVGAPVWKPEGYRTARVTAGFNLNYGF
ncbi:hypothetical protein DBA29_15785 [Xenophilus aerolatus]|nr:hypothetical protein [Xenophilus aerolatus]